MKTTCKQQQHNIDNETDYIRTILSGHLIEPNQISWEEFSAVSGGHGRVHVSKW